ncbi:MAG: DUF2510 domain-containing protein, partial [Actinobacteria bacterium]|nr:DUF2510 domain-containing protein [Actinomycetota bacterium]
MSDPSAPFSGGQAPGAPSAGWYPDPAGPGSRYWDGARWTEHTQPLPGTPGPPHPPA